MRHLILTGFLLTIVVVTTAQTFEVYVSTDSVLLGNYIEVEFVAENLNGKFEAPQFQGMSLISGPNVSTSMQSLNGRVSSLSTHTYYLEPEDIGQYTIPPAYFIDGEETYETAPLDIRVYPNPNGIIQSPPERKRSYFFDFDRNFPVPDIKGKENKRKYKQKIKKI